MRFNWYQVSPEAYKSMLAIQEIVNKSSLDHKLLELIKIRVSQINGCAHCLDMHTKEAIAIGETEQRIYLLTAWREAPIYSSSERAALAWCESLTNISIEGAPEEHYNNLQKYFTSEEIVELTLAIVAINGWNRLAIAFKSGVGIYASDTTLDE